MQNKSFDPFENLVLDEYEQELEDSFARGDFVSSSDEELEKTRDMLQKAAKKRIQARKSQSVTFRLQQGNLIKLKAKAKEVKIPYQTLLGALIDQYVNGKIKIVL